MADPRDNSFLQLCLTKGLLSKELVERADARATNEGRRVTAVLVDLGVMAQHTVEAIEREVERAIAPRTIAGFRIVRKLGQGGMGTVYLAVQVSLQREVALKIISPHIAADREAAERFVREARIAAAVNHPNIIGIIDAGEDGGELFMALELITGGDASQLAARFNGVLPEARALEIIADCCRGLQALYEARLIHRDIKPANIFITGEGVAKLADLGLARSEGGDDRLTVSGFAVGTPAFMSPEQANGEPGIDIRTDIYSLGATLFALATGSQPFTGNGPFAIAAKVLTQPVPEPRSLNPALSPAIAAVILRAMAKKPEQRYQTPAALLQALEEAAAAPAHGAPFPRPAAGAAVGVPASATAVTKVLPAPGQGALHASVRSHSAPRTQRSSPRPARQRWPLVLAVVGVLAVLSVPLLIRAWQPPVNVPGPGHANLTPVAPPPPGATHPGATPPGPGPGREPQGTRPPEAPARAVVAEQAPGAAPPAEQGQRATTPPPSPPAWAVASGRDSYGAWADLHLGAAVQRLRWIDAGTFVAGSPPGEPGHVAMEEQQTVTISRGFWLADSECTQALWLELMGSNPSAHAGDPRQPVENLRFDEAEGFLQRLSMRTAGSLARLPTRCEFEYAERAGSSSAYFYGDDAAAIAAYGNVKGSGPGAPLPVRSLKPNRWGLYDMIGNVTEWTYGAFVPPSTLPALDPELAGRATLKGYLIKGGSFQHSAALSRSACYGNLGRLSATADVGFRILIEQAAPDTQPAAGGSGNQAAAGHGDGAAKPSTTPLANPPAWAVASGRDGYGPWADLRIGAVTQRMRWIDGGTFIAGSPPGEAGRRLYEAQQRVTISRGFWLADSHCTQSLWMELMGSNPSGHAGDPRLPVENMRFDQAEDFLKRLSERTAGSQARLPTRCEFEYAARAGSLTAFSFGEDPAPISAYANVLDSGPGRTLPVRSLKPNRWGLYDMSGNLYAWVYGENIPLTRVASIDPELAERATNRSYDIKGGSFTHPANDCRSAALGFLRQESHGSDVGFRFLIEEVGRPEPSARTALAPTGGASPAPGARGDKASPRPAWAAAVGTDAFGSWADLRLGVEIQRLRWIEPGTFVMGSPLAEKGRGEWEEQRPVTISHGFWLGDSSCTQEVWLAVMGRNPALHGGVAQLPVHGISFDDALVFLDKLSKRLAGGIARLPTRAEWEFAARAGATTAYVSGDDPTLAGAFGNTRDNGPGHLIAGRSLKPNRWGLYDVMGNVAQWVYGVPGALPAGANIDPDLASHPAQERCYIRGGSYGQVNIHCRLAGSGILPHDCRNEDLGMRILIEQAVRSEP